MDIGFAAGGGLDTVTLKTFVGSGNGFVTTWYDQSGNGRHATQATAANQPQIVNAGAVLTENGKPKIAFDGANDNLFTSFTATTFVGVSGFVVGKLYSTTGVNTGVVTLSDGVNHDYVTNGIIVWNSGWKNAGASPSGADARYNNTSFVANADLAMNNTYIYSYLSQFGINANGALVAASGSVSNTPATIRNLAIGSRVIASSLSSLPSYFAKTDVSEVIVFGSNISNPERAVLEVNQSNYYAIPYTADNVLDNLGLNNAVGAEAAHSVRKLSTTYTGNAMQIRRSNDNALLDIGFDSNGNLDTTAIQNHVTTNDGYVTIWYDQTGHNNHFRQTTVAQQPRIASAGVIDRKNGQPAIRHIATSQHNLAVSASYLVTNNPWTISVVQGLDGGANGRMLQASSNSIFGFHGGNEQRIYSGLDGVWFNNAYGTYLGRTATTNNQIYTFITSGSLLNAFNNGLQINGTTSATAPGTLFTSSTGEPSNGTMQELVTFSTSLSNTNRSKLEANQGAYYGVVNLYVSTATGGNWNSTSTWEGGIVPPSGTNADVVIATTGSNTVVLDVNTTVRSLNVNPGSIINMGSSNIITTTGITTNSGTIITSNPNGLIGVLASTSISATTTIQITNTIGSTVTYNSSSAQTVTNGITYASLTISNSAAAKTLAAGSIAYVTGDLTIDAGVTFNKAGLDLFISGSLFGTGLLSSTGGTLRLEQFFSSTTATLGTLFMAPSPNNVVDNLHMRKYNSTNNTANLILGSTLRVNNNLNMERGYITSTASNLLQMVNASTSNGNSLSFVIGPIEISTSATSQRLLPVGKNGLYGPVWITPATAQSSTYTAQYFNGTAVVPNTSNLDANTVTAVYNNQYWEVFRTAGTSNIALQLGFNQAPNGGTASQALIITNYTGGNWTGIGANAFIPANTSLANIATASSVTNTGQFSLGYASTIVSTQSGNWNSTSTWAGGVVPSATSDVRIASGHTVTLNAAASALRVQIDTGGIFNLTTNQLSGTTAGIQVYGTVITANVNGLYGATASLPVATSANSTFFANSKVIYNAGADQFVTALTYQKLTITNSAAIKTLLGTTIVSDSLEITSLTNLNKAAQALTINGALAGLGNISSSGGSITVGGAAGRVATLYAGTISNTSLTLNRNNGTSNALVLATPLSITTLTLTNGILKTDSTNLLTLANSVIGSSSASAYINGPVRITTASTNSVLLPLGNNGMYSNVAITPTATTSTSWVVDFINNTVPNNTNIGSGLTGLGTNQYWKVSRNNSNNASFSIDFFQGAGGATSSTLRLAIYNSNWTPVSVTNSSLLANSTTGTLTTVSAVTLNAIPNSIDFFAIGFIANIVPTSILSNGSGNWSNAATWLPAQVPSAGDDVTIQNGHNVTLDVNIVSGLGPKSVTVNTGGTLSVPDGVVYNNTIFANTVLDNITAPVAAAFGLRKLRASYNGPAIRVRRNDNNAEQDIFFDAFGNLNQFTLTEFVGNASGLVTRWYDQSGNGLDFTQTTPSRQPRIVNGGEIETKNGVPAIRHVAAALQNLAMSNPLTNSTPWTVNVVQGMDGGSNARLLNGSNNWLLGFWNGFQNMYYSGNAWINGSAIATTDNQVYTAVTNGTTSVFRSGTPLTGSVSAAAPGTTLWTSGWNNGSEFSNGTLQEVILYNTSLSATDRNTLENSQSNYYINGILQSSVAGIVISGTLQIANANGLDSAIKGSPASFNTGSSLTYNGTAQNVTPINVGNITFAGSGTKTLTGLLTVSQSLTVNSGVTFNKAAQNLAINNATITNNGTMSSTGGILSLGGTGALSLGFNSLNNTVAQLQLNRTGNITLTQPLNVSTSATFTAGVLVTDATNIVTLTNAAVTGGSNTSYINGPAIVASTNITTKRVPVGKNNLLATVTITPQSATATNYAVEYFNGVGTTPNSSNLGAGLTGVATNQYWNVSRTLGTATAELSFNFNTSAGGTGSQNIALASYGTSGPWNSSVINTPILANAISGTMVGTYTQSSYGNFGIGYIANITETGLDSLSLTSATTSSLALSIRKLRSAYTGPAIRVRRSTDSLEANIGFLANGNLDTVTLKAFVGVGNNGFVTTWYDQSGNNRNAVQTTAGFQPTIVAGGTISYFNNRPTFVYDGVDDGFRVSNLPTQTDNVNSLFWIQRTTDVNYMPMNNNGGSWTMIASSGDNTSTDIAGIGSYSVSSFMINGRPTDWTTATTRGAVHTALNNTAAIVNILNQPITWNGSMVIANSWGGTWNYNGLMPEIVITNTTLDSARRVGIEISMGNYYTIGTPNNGWISTAAGGNWNTGSTWTVGTVPPDGASVVIATTNDNKVVLNVNANVGSLITNTNAILDLGNTNTIAATSGITNNGTLITAHANGLLGASASINAASITNNVGSSVTYNGSSIQTVSAITYRKLRISNSAALKNTAGAFTITDTFTIDAGATLVQANTAHALTFIGNIAGTGVIQPNATSTINITGATGGSFGTINFAASPNNSVGTFVMNRGGVNSTVTLGSSLQVNTTISLIAGNINTTNANLLIANNISTTSGSIASYVDGPVRFVNLASGNTRTAHIGKGGFLGTITVNPTSISDWTVEYFSEPATPTTPLSSSLNSLINNQYWSVTKGSNAAASATLSFFFNKPLGGNATDRIIFANYNSADVTPTWLPVILASNAFNGASSTGTVTTANALAFATGTNVNNKYTFAYAGPWQSAQTGNWKTASTWLQGSVPISGAQVTIKAGHTVTVDTTIASGGGTPTQIIIESGAQLNFDTNTFASTPITVSGVLATANALGINTSNSNGTITYNTGSTLIYNGGNQNIPTVSGVLTNLTIGGTPGSTKTLTGAITVDKLLTINTGVTFSKGSQNLTLNGTYVGNGSFTSISGNFTIGGSLGGSFGNLNLTGSVGTFTVARYGASPSVTMTTPFNATAISMQNGVLNTDATNTVTITGTSTGPGSNVAYVNGPLKIAQSTTSAITLPLGKSGVLGSVTITPTTGITSWTLEFYNGSPTVITTDGTLVSISTAQYWDIVRNSGTSTATLAFNFSQTPGGLPSQGISLAKFNTSNSLWESQLTNANTFRGNASSGTLTAPSGISTAPSGQNIFGNFAIGFYEGEFVSAQSGNWNSASTWVSNTIPINTSRVTIKAGHTVSLDTSASPSNLTLEAGSRFNFNNNQLTSPSLGIVNSGTISTQLAAGLNGAVGASIPNGSFLMQSGSDIQYVGSTQQTVSNLAYQKLTINNGAGAVMASDITVNDSLKLSSGTLTIGSNTLLLNGGLSGSGTLKGSPTSNLTMGGSGNVTLFVDQTTPGTTNRFATVTLNRSGNTITLGNSMEVNTALTLTAGKLAIGSNTLTLNGTFSGSADNSLSSNGSFLLAMGGSGNATLFVDQT
ncbi:MAG TPA: hypothetical protein DIU05_06395, partial [Bacteroidetes bacterium]|nr:hypothetical protein [Bacteroidota bacterium]